MVEEEVDDHAGDGDVHPEGEGVAGDDAVLVEFFEPGAAEGYEDHGDDDYGEDGVRDEDCEIDGADPALALEARHGQLGSGRRGRRSGKR